MNDLITYFGRALYHGIDRVYRGLDRRFVRRTRNLRNIPGSTHRKGGKTSYAEWAHVIGIFQALLYTYVPQKPGVRVLDVGCGNGLLALAAEPFIGDTGSYLGIDVDALAIHLCRRDYLNPCLDFLHLPAQNAVYAPEQGTEQMAWPLEAESFDALLALSVWTHFNEEDARFYWSECARVLKPGGTAIISFFLLDDQYQRGIGERGKQPSRFHTTATDRWVFDTPAYGSVGWRYPSSLRVPELAIGITAAGFEDMVQGSRLALERTFPGNWREQPGLYFQDVGVFKKR